MQPDSLQPNSQLPSSQPPSRPRPRPVELSRLCGLGLGLALLVGLSACSATNSTPARGSEPTPAETLELYPPGTDPLITYQSFKAAFAAKEFAAIFDLSSEKTRREFQGFLQQLRSDQATYEAQLGIDLDELLDARPRDAFARLTREMVERSPDEYRRLTQAQLQGEPMEQLDFCILRRTFPDGGEDDIELVRENGLWWLGNALSQ